MNDILLTISQISKKYTEALNKLSHVEFRKRNNLDLSFSCDDILGDFVSGNTTSLFLNVLTDDDIKSALDKTGIIKSLKKQGLDNIFFVTDTKDNYRHIFRGYFEKADIDHLLCEAVFSKKRFKAEPVFESEIKNQIFNLIAIEWMLLQNPTAEFPPHRFPLPGQLHPGLRIGRKVLRLLIDMALRLKSDGLLNVPEHYHNAAFYSRQFKYFKPELEGYFQAIRRDLLDFGLYNITWAIEKNCLIETKTKENWNWLVGEQILPVSRKMKKYFKSDEYKEHVKKAYNSVKFAIDIKKYEEAMD